MVNLEALANDLRAAGCSVYPDDPKQSPWKGDGDYCQISVNNRTKVTDQGDLLAFGFLDAQTIAIIARHLGAGPVAADRAALVERMAQTIIGMDDDDDWWNKHVTEVAAVALAVVEAAGWGPRAEPVAPPEPLSADEEMAMFIAASSAWIGATNPADAVQRLIDAVLAALPERYAVRREGA